MLIISGYSYSQDFEGEIKYELNYISKSSQYTLEIMQNEFGTETTTYIKNGFYKEITDSKFMSYQLFRYVDNRIYFQHKVKSDTLWYSLTISEQKLDFKYEIHEKSDTILNIVCDKLIYQDEYGIKTYYYSSDYSLNPELYKDFTYSNKYEILKLMKSVYLKLVMEYEPFIVEITATDIKRKVLNDKVFDLPKHTILIKQ